MSIEANWIEPSIRSSGIQTYTGTHIHLAQRNASNNMGRGNYIKNYLCYRPHRTENKKKFIIYNHIDLLPPLTQWPNTENNFSLACQYENYLKNRPRNINYSIQSLLIKSAHLNITVWVSALFDCIATLLISSRSVPHSICLLIYSFIQQFISHNRTLIAFQFIIAPS